MSRKCKGSKMTERKLHTMLKSAVEKGMVKCPYCYYKWLEPDYERCPKCKKRNPMITMGCI